MSSIQKLTLEQLQAYQGNKAEIVRLGAELANMRVEHDRVRGSMPVHPYCATTFTMNGINVKAAARIRRRRERLQAQQHRLEQYVAGVPDPIIRCIMQLRYIGGLSWGNVAKSIGGCNTSDSVRMAIKRYFSTVSS